jgi:hypothetical protein
MTDHGPSLLPAPHAEPTHDIAQTAALSKGPGPRPQAERPRRSAQWFAASGRWMDRSFDPVEAEAIRESYRSVPPAAEDDGA